MKLVFTAITIACMLTGFGGLGYVWFEVLGLDSTPGQFGFGLIGLAWALGFVWLVRRIHAPPSNKVDSALKRKVQEEAKELLRVYEERKGKRIAEFASDPVRRKYIPEVHAGRMLAELEVEYAEDPEMTVACRHLAPVEAAMRRAGVVCRPIVGWDGNFDRNLSCVCWLDMDKLKQRMKLADCVEYYHYVDYRDGDDRRLLCRECKSGLHLEPQAGAPEFPA